MALTYRDEKGSPLSADEVDENFRTLVTMINSSTGDTGVGIASITQAGSTITIHLTDATTQGPFDIPTAAFNDTGEWVAEYAYNELDLFSVPNVGLYLVLIEHTSGSEFDPDLIDTDGNPVLRRLISLAQGPQNVILADAIPTSIDLPIDWRNAYVRIYDEIGDGGQIVVLEDADGYYDIGDFVTLRQSGPGQLTIVASTGVTINTPETYVSRKQGATITLIHVNTNEWDLAGDLELAPASGTTTEPPAPPTTTA